MWSELLSNRCETRSNFIEQEQISTLSYQKDLKLSLEQSKKVLGCLTVGRSSEEKVPLNAFSQVFHETKRLFSNLKTSRQSRDLLRSKLLISRQLVEENRCKAMEIESENEETLTEVNFKLEKQKKTLTKIEKYVRVLLEELNITKEISSRVISISKDSLSLHNKLQSIKDSVAHYSRRTNQVRATTENLQVYARHLNDEFTKHQIFIQNPTTTNNNEDQCSNTPAHFSTDIATQANEKARESINRKLKSSRILLSKLLCKNNHFLSRIAPRCSNTSFELNQAINDPDESLDFQRLASKVTDLRQDTSEYSSVNQNSVSHDQDSVFINFISEIN